MVPKSSPYNDLDLWGSLQKQVPLDVGTDNSQHRLQDGSRKHQLTSGMVVQNVFLRKMFPNLFTLVVSQAQMRAHYRDTTILR